MRSLKSLSRFTVCAAALMLCHAAWAADTAPLVQGNQTAITEQDLRADALRIPPETRARILTRPDQVVQIANNLFVRRVMAQEAQAANLQADADIAAALQIARDKVLSDAWLAKIDKDNLPTDAALEGLARNTYNANSDRFKVAERVQIRHILVASGPDDLAKAEKLLTDLKQGGDFAALAKAQSADPGSASKGGDLGLFARGSMVPEFDDAAFALKQPGDLSGLVKTRFGYHVLQLQDRRPAGVRPFEEVRDELMKEVRATILQNARAGAAQKIQAGAKVNSDAVDAFAAGYKAP